LAALGENMEMKCERERMKNCGLEFAAHISYNYEFLLSILLSLTKIPALSSEIHETMIK